MKRWLLILLAAFGCAPESSDQALVLSSRYDALFVAAGQKHGVPAQVLAVTAQALTRTEMVDGDGEWGRPTFGLMAIPAEWISDDDANARTDPAANVELAARLLSERAERLQIDRADLRAWSKVITDYARVDDPTFMRDEVLRPLGVLEDGDVAIKRQALSPDYDLGVWRPSPHFNSRGGRTPQFVIIHTCEGGYSGCWGWQTNPASEVSAHYTVSDGSEVTQLVRESDRAWHVAAQYQCANNNGVRCDLNGVSTNTISVGIEHAGYAAQASFPGSQLDASARLVCSITRTWGIPRDRNHILSHGQLQPNNRTDPGPNWPWDAFIRKVRDVCGDDMPPPCDRTAGEFTFSCDGPQASQTCVNLDEPSDPDTWNDNFLCSARDYGFRWSHAGPIDGMDCTGVHEAAEPLAAAWSDNYLCAPKQSPWLVTYSSAGPLTGKTCVHLNETLDLANSWSDNYLCFEPRFVFEEGEFSFASAGPVSGRSCVSVATSDPDAWADNWLCTTSELGLTWSTTGPEEGKQCVAITEPADATPAAWRDTYLCAPADARYRFEWSSAGPLEQHQCLRWFDHAESATWLDNWLCMTPIAPAPVKTPVVPPQPQTIEAPAAPLELQAVQGGCSTSAAGALTSLVLLLLLNRRRAGSGPVLTRRPTSRCEAERT